MDHVNHFINHIQQGFHSCYHDRPKQHADSIRGFTADSIIQQPQCWALGTVDWCASRHWGWRGGRRFARGAGGLFVLEAAQKPYAARGSLEQQLGPGAHATACSLLFFRVHHSNGPYTQAGAGRGT
jgi:hypothetical protein